MKRQFCHSNSKTDLRAPYREGGMEEWKEKRSNTETEGEEQEEGEEGKGGVGGAIYTFKKINKGEKRKNKKRRMKGRTQGRRRRGG